MEIRNIILSTCMLFACLLGYGSNVENIPISHLNVSKDNESLNVSFNVNAKDSHVTSNQRLSVTPLLISADGKDSLSLPSFTVAGRSAWYNIIRNRCEQEFPGLMRADEKTPLQYMESINFEGWMLDSRLDFVKSVVCYCDDKLQGGPEIVPGATMDWRKKDISPKFYYITPPVDTVKIFNLSGRADVNFKVNRTELLPDYMNNKVELRKILESIHAIGDDPDVTSYHITLTGYASPEGSYENNLRLAKGRTEAVKKYIFSLYSLDPKMVDTSWVAEDWQGLRNWVDSSRINNRNEILRIIDSDLAPDAKDNELKVRFPVQYSYLLGNVYPSLRHTDYEIRYTVRKYADVAEIREMMNMNPGKLCLNELFIGATSYPEGSPEYFAAFELAASLYPSSQIANLNAAMAALESRDLVKAEKYLTKSGDSADADYLRGIFFALKKDYSSSMAELNKAASKNYGPAVKAIEEVKIAENQNGVITYFIHDASSVANQ